MHPGIYNSEMDSCVKYTCISKMTEFKDEAAAGRRDLENVDLPKKVIPKKKTSKIGTLLHLIKAHVGPGILALPNAISNAGLV